MKMDTIAVLSTILGEVFFIFVIMYNCVTMGRKCEYQDQIDEAWNEFWRSL